MMEEVMLDINDSVTRVLANENINVSRSGKIKTPYFDLLKREIVLPIWEGIDPIVIDMVTFHEISHALFTPSSYMDEAKKSPVFARYLNIVEDPRVEREFKKLYPGTRKTFIEGYKSLSDTDFFGVDIETVNDRNFIDRINIFFKLGALSGVKFASDEVLYVERITKSTTFEEVVEIANDIYEFAKKKKEEEKSKNEPNKEEETDSSFEEKSSEELVVEESDITPETSDESDITPEASDESDITPETSNDSEEGDKSDETSDDSEEGDKSDETSDDSEESDKSNETSDDSEEGDSNKSKACDTRINKDESEGDECTFNESDIAPETSDNLSEVMSSYATESNETEVFYEINDDFTQYKTKLDYKDVLDKIRRNETPEIIKSKKSLFAKFKSNSTKHVSHLINQFEMKKAADIYTKRTTAKTGSLNVKRISQYKLSDDIFKRNTIVPEGKNHGMVMLLDWSSSMSRGSYSSGTILENSIKQTIMLVMFCRKVGIPHRVYAFSNKIDTWLANNNIDETMWDGKESCLTLIELFTEKQTNHEFTAMAESLNDRYEFIKLFRTYYTPLNPALVAMRKYIPQFKMETGVDKVSLIVFSDGETTDVFYNANYSSHVKLRDGKTKKSYLIKTRNIWNMEAEFVNETNALYSILKDRMDINIISFYVQPYKTISIKEILKTGCTVFAKSKYTPEFSKFTEEFNKYGFASLTAPGRDKNFIVNSSILSDKGLNVGAFDESSSANQIAKSLKKNSASSKLLVEKFIETIS